MINKATIGGLYARLKASPLFKDSFWALLGSAIGKGLALLAGVVVARFLGKDIYGEYGTIRTTLTYVAIVSTFGFGYTATKFIVEYLEKQKDKVRSLVRHVTTITLLFSVFLALLQTVFAGHIAEFLDAPYLEKTLRSFSILVVFNALTTTQIAILSGFKKFKEIAKINSYAGIIVFVASIVLTYVWGLNGALMALLLSFVAQTVISARYINKSLLAVGILPHAQDQKDVDRREVLSMLKFSVPIALQESLYTVVHWLNVWLLIHFADFGQVGLSSAAALWQSVVIFVPGMLKNVMFSYLTSAKDHVSLVRKLLLVNLVSTIVPVLVISVLSNFISSWYGATFVDLPKVLNVSVCSAIFICLSEVFCYEFISQGKPWTVFMARFLRDTLILIGTYLVFLHVNGEQAYWAAIVALGGNFIFLCVLYVCYEFNYKRNMFK